MSRCKPTLRESIKRATRLKAEAQALRTEHAKLSAEMKAIRKEHERAKGKVQTDMTLTNRLIEERRAAQQEHETFRRPTR